MGDPAINTPDKDQISDLEGLALHASVSGYGAAADLLKVVISRLKTLEALCPKDPVGPRASGIPSAPRCKSSS